MTAPYKRTPRLKSRVNRSSSAATLARAQDSSEAELIARGPRWHAANNTALVVGDTYGANRDGQ